MIFANTRRPIELVAAFTVLAWLGEYIHNLYELPQLTLFSPENSIPALVYLILFMMWWLLPYRRITAILLLVWTAVNLFVGAIITVIPFPFLPFYPEQNLEHYLAHLLYGAALLPLMSTMLRHWRQYQ